MTPEEFGRELNELRTIINDGIIYFSAWQGISTETEEATEALNRYRGFFLPARNALLWMALMQFAMIFDRNPRTVSLRTIVSKAKADVSGLTPNTNLNELEVIHGKIDAMDAVLVRLTTLRNQRIAHHDSHPYGDRSVLLGEVKGLVEEVKEMYNALTLGHNRSTSGYHLIEDDPKRHPEQVVKIMKEERIRVQRRLLDSPTNS